MPAMDLALSTFSSCLEKPEGPGREKVNPSHILSSKHLVKTRGMNPPGSLGSGFYCLCSGGQSGDECAEGSRLFPRTAERAVSGARAALALCGFLPGRPPVFPLVSRGAGSDGNGMGSLRGWLSCVFRGLWELGTWEVAKQGSPPGLPFLLVLQVQVEALG